MGETQYIYYRSKQYLPLSTNLPYFQHTIKINFDKIEKKLLDECCFFLLEGNRKHIFTTFETFIYTKL